MLLMKRKSTYMIKSKACHETSQTFQAFPSFLSPAPAFLFLLSKTPLFALCSTEYRARARCFADHVTKRNVRVLSIVPKIPEISVGIQMERFVSVSSDRNIRDHSTPVPFMTNRYFALIREFGQRI